jgi:hypothetical protein
MNLEHPQPISRQKIFYEKNKEYYKNYYQQHKDKWNDYSEKLCECGVYVKSLYHHQRSKKHRDIIRIVNLNNQKLMENNESTPQDRSQGIHEGVLPKE